MRANDFSSFNDLKNQIRLLIVEEKFNSALKLIQNYVECIISEPLCTSKIFGSLTLDEFCQSIGKLVAERNSFQVLPTLSNDKKSGVVVYIVTKLYLSGGHSRVVRDLVHAMPYYRHLVLSTELDGSSRISEARQNDSDAENKYEVELSPPGNHLTRLIWLQSRLTTLQPEKVYLFNHHQDSVAVASVQPRLNSLQYFYHHGDHHFCLGVFVKHLIHIDSHPMGFYNCKNSLGIENKYLPLSIIDRKTTRNPEVFFKFEQLRTCTAARSNKIEIPYSYSYIKLIPRLLKSTQGDHIHIGKLTIWGLLRLRLELFRNGIDQNKFLYIPYVASVWDELVDKNVDLYIASFPYGGGLTLIEAMGSGTPVALHKHTFSNILSGLDLSYPEAFRWQIPEDLISFCEELTLDKLSIASRQGRAHYLKFNSEICFEKVISEPLGVLEQAPYPLQNFIVDQNEWAFSTQKHLTIGRLGRRGLLRRFKLLRAFTQKLFR